MSHNSIIKKIIVKLHLYTGLILGLVITLICLSGTAIVYKPELEKLSVKDIAFVKPASRTVPPQTLLENVRCEYPQAKINNMVLYGGEDCAYSFLLHSRMRKAVSRSMSIPIQGKLREWTDTGIRFFNGYTTFT